MSKKKVVGSTMTLKDFHGGSIQSDFPLPSAPGMPKLTTDRPGPWGAPIGRPDQRTRPNSSHTLRNFDDKSLFPHTANIGRNFNEDERKPLDGHSAPRRTVNDEVFRAANNRLEVKADSLSTGRQSGWSAPTGKMSDVTHTGENKVSGTHSNVWPTRREVPAVNNEPVHSPWTAQPAVSNLVQSKLLVPSQTDFDIVKHSEIDNRGYKTSGPVLNQRDELHGRHVERGLTAEDGIQSGRKFSREYDKVSGPTYLDAREGKSVANSSDKLHSNYSDVRPAGHVGQPTSPSEVVARPRLNLLPRTKPLESIEKPVNDGKLENDASNIVHRETGYATQKSSSTLKPGSSADEISNQPGERPKVTAKPLLQILQQPEVKTEKERNAVFGGARPREQVLKERGIDEPEHHKPEQNIDSKRTVLKPIERVPEHAIQRPLSSPRDPRSRKFDQKDGRGGVSDIARSETQRRNWRDNDTKNTRQQQQQTQEKTRHPSPETWRKPVPEKPESPDGTGIRYGKTASPLELAQAFSDPKSGTGSNSFNMSRNNQQPFSRLVGSTTTGRQINGY